MSVLDYSTQKANTRYIIMIICNAPTGGESRRVRGGKAWRGDEGGTGRGWGQKGRRSEAINGDLPVRSHDEREATRLGGAKKVFQSRTLLVDDSGRRGGFENKKRRFEDLQPSPTWDFKSVASRLADRRAHSFPLPSFLQGGSGGAS